MTKEALTLALEALAQLKGELHEEIYVNGLMGAIDKPIAAIKEALSSPNGEAQPEQEPVAWIYEFYADMGHKGLAFEEQHSAYNTPLYTTPPQRKPLTRGQIREIEVDVSLNQSFDYITPAEQLCRAIEAAHGIKENT